MSERALLPQPGDRFELGSNDAGVMPGLISGGRCAVLRHVGSEEGLGDAVRYVRPSVRLAWRDVAGEGRAFVAEPFAPGQAQERGLTVGATTVPAANRTAVDLTIEGWQWLGLPIELAERGVSDSVRSLAAFALPR